MGADEPINYSAAAVLNLFNDLCYAALKVHDYSYGTGLIFFGFTCLVNGVLIRRSGYLPRTIGILIQVAGLCYLINSFSLLLFPAFAHRIFPVTMGLPFLAELSFCMWLLFKGVDLRNWDVR